MNNPVLSTTVRFVSPVLLVFSLVLLARGHQMPGGGFVGGLIAAAAFTLQVMGEGVSVTQKEWRVSPWRLSAAGLCLAVAVGCVGLFEGRPFLSGSWFTVDLGTTNVELGTPLLFDLGVYMVVLGAVLGVIRNVERD